METLTTARSTHKLDRWMLRFLIEFALPLQEDTTLREPEPPIDGGAISDQTQRLVLEGRFTDFAATGLALP